MDGAPEAAEREVNLVQVAPQRMSRSRREPKPAAVARRGRLPAANLHSGVRAASMILCVGVGEDQKGKAFAAGSRY